jgi:hypothetical protein
MISKRILGIGMLAGLTLLSGCSDSTKQNSISKLEEQSKSGELIEVNPLYNNPTAISNFCNELIASREFEMKNPRSNLYSELAANKAYVTKLTEIIACLKGDNYSVASYARARVEFHKAVEAYSK